MNVEDTSGTAATHQDEGIKQRVDLLARNCYQLHNVNGNKFDKKIYKNTNDFFAAPQLLPLD